MTYYLIVACAKCGKYLLAKGEQKTRTCPYCGSTVTLDKAKKIASAKTALQASALLSELKSNKAVKNKDSKSLR